MAALRLGRLSTRIALMDVGLILSSLILSAWLERPFVGLRIVAEFLFHWTGATMIGLTLHLLTFYVFELYNLELDFRKSIPAFRVVVAVLVAGVFIALASFVLPIWGLTRPIFLVHGLTLTTFMLVSRWWLSGRTRTRVPPIRALLVTVGVTPDEVVEEFFRNPESRYHMVGSVPVSAVPQSLKHSTPISVVKASSIPPPVGTVHDCEEALAREHARCLIVAGIDRLPRDAANELLRLKEHGIEVHDLCDLYRDLSGRIPLALVDTRYFLREPAFTRDTAPILSNLTRVLDIVGALVLLVLSAPLWLAAFLGIKLTMPGPVFYKQERVGKGEVPYILYKFRSMRLDAEKDGPRWASGVTDPRVTPFGRFLRRTRIDELPQLWNVLLGDMSLVGPRPERPVFVSELKKEIPYYSLRFQVKPGVTGWAQVNYRYGASIEDTRVKLSYDLFYVQYRSIALYLITLIKTITTVIFKPGS